MTRLVPSSVLVSALLLVSFETFAQESASAPAPGEQRVMAGEARSDGEEDRLGAVVAPVVLPAGSTALYGFVGAPELGVGFRQGLGGVELEARGRLNWFQLSAALELGVRLEVLKRGPLSLAPTLGLGVVLNSGSTYMDDDNFSGVLARVSPGLVAGYKVGDTVARLGLVDLPVDVGLTRETGQRLQALGGGGVEVYLGSNLSVLAAGQVGVETFRERFGDRVTRLGWSTRLGLGARLF